MVTLRDYGLDLVEHACSQTNHRPGPFLLWATMAELEKIQQSKQDESKQGKGKKGKDQ
jgi:hypothetical protein